MAKCETQRDFIFYKGRAYTVEQQADNLLVRTYRTPETFVCLAKVGVLCKGQGPGWEKWDPKTWDRDIQLETNQYEGHGLCQPPPRVSGFALFPSKSSTVLEDSAEVPPEGNRCSPSGAAF